MQLILHPEFLKFMANVFVISYGELVVSMGKNFWEFASVSTLRSDVLNL